MDGTPSRDTATSTAAATTTTAANASPALNLAAVHATQTPTARGTPRASVAASPSAAPGSARARGAIPAPGGGTPAAGSRLPQRTKAADPGTPAGGGGVPGGTGMPVVGLTPAVQLQKHDAALEALRGEMAEVKVGWQCWAHCDVASLPQGMWGRCAASTFWRPRRMRDGGMAWPTSCSHSSCHCRRSVPPIGVVGTHGGSSPHRTSSGLSTSTQGPWRRMQP